MGIWTRIWRALTLTVLLGVVLVVPLSWAAVAFLRDRLRYRCSYDGGFLCADGNGYALGVLALGFGAGILLLATAAVAASLQERPSLATRGVTGLGIAGIVFTLVASIVADSGRHPLDNVPADTWLSVMAIPSLLLGAAGIALVLVVVSPPRLPPRVGLWAALVLTATATVVEATLAFGTVPVLFAVIVALSTASAPVTSAPSASER